MEINFAGRLRWHGKQGRLEIRYDEARNAWYASIPVEVGVEETKMGKKSKYIVRGERKSIRMVGPRGDEAAAVDLGINILASAVTNSGVWLLYRGSRAKEDFFYLSRKIAEVQSEADSARNAGDREGPGGSTGGSGGCSGSWWGAWRTCTGTWQTIWLGASGSSGCLRYTWAIPMI